MSNAHTTQGPCRGVRVVEFATMLSGPYCGQMLADMGADVIKVEPAEGDGLRAIRPEHKGLGATFVHSNRGKRSIGIDLKSSRGAALARDLVKTADVVLENFRPGVMTRLGLDYDRLRAVNENLIYVSLTGFGDSGPYAGRPAYDHVIQALTGYMWAQGEYAAPQPVRNSIVDKVSAMTACNATLAALLHRASGGGGQRVSVSLFDAYAAFIIPGFANNYTFIGAGLAHYPPRAVFQVIPTMDGHVMGYIHTDAQFAGCARAFGREDVLADPRFANPKDRLTHVKEMWAEMAIGARSRSTAQIMEIAVAANVPLAPVNSVEQFMQDPQTLHNQVFVDYHDEAVGTLRQMNFPARFEKSPANTNARAPRLGEHTDEILQGLGLSAEDISGLRAARNVW